MTRYREMTITYNADLVSDEQMHDLVSGLCRCRRHWWQFWRGNDHLIITAFTNGRDIA